MSKAAPEKEAFLVPFFLIFLKFWFERCCCGSHLIWYHCQSEKCRPYFCTLDFHCLRLQPPKRKFLEKNSKFWSKNVLLFLVGSLWKGPCWALLIEKTVWNGKGWCLEGSCLVHLYIQVSELIRTFGYTDSEGGGVARRPFDQLTDL